MKCLKLISLTAILILCFQTYAKPLGIPTTGMVSHLKPMLNSDRIEYLFGSYGVLPLQACDKIFQDGRISNLYSLQGEQAVMRTLALVDFVHPMPKALTIAHEKIQKGQSIGTTLKNERWNLIKKPVYFGEIALPKKVRDMMHDQGKKNAAVFIYQLIVSNEAHPDPIHYCNIIEIYSPEYLTLDWLKALYKEDYPQHKGQTPMVNQVLARAQLCLKEF